MPCAFSSMSSASSSSALRVAHRAAVLAQPLEVERGRPRRRRRAGRARRRPPAERDQLVELLEQLPPSVGTSPTGP
jgi:hypothetical protein